MESLNNSLSALDTRVTNAINGGSLAPPVSYNVLLSPYTDRLYYSSDGKTYSSAPDNATASKYYHSYVRDDMYNRVWNNTYKVPQKGKLIANISMSAPSGVSNKKLEVLSTSNAVLLNANLNGTTDLSSLAGQTVKFRASCTFGYHQAITITYNSLTLTNN